MAKIGFIQLPLLEPGADPGRSNVPLAAGYLRAAARGIDAGGRARLETAPRTLADYGGDEAVVRWAVEGGFDLVGFTVYLWNRERSFALAREIRRRSPRTGLIAGGPDLVEADAAASGRCFDALVVGEGEPVLAGLLDDLEAGRPLPKTYHSSAPADLERLPNPYLLGLLDEYRGAPIYLETMRGCPYACAYCYYGKHRRVLRRFPAEDCAELVRLAAAWGSPEIYLMDPSFNATADLDRRLSRLAEANSAGLPLHTELRLESVDAGRAELMRRAGFVSVEAGLQSVNPAALAAVNRGFDRPAFERGARELLSRGIRIRTGLILGLPEDRLDDFARSLEFAAGLGLEADLEIYPLALLPDTELRERAEELGIRYMPRPPYWVLETPAMPAEDLFAGLALAERSLGIDYFKPIPPAPAFASGFIHRAGLRRPGDERALLEHPELLGNQCALLIGPAFHEIDAGGLPSASGLGRLRGLAGALLAYNRFGLYQLIIDRPGFLDPSAAELIAEAFYDPSNPFNNFQYFRVDSQPRFSVRLFHLSGDPRVVAERLERKAAGETAAAELMLAYRSGMRAAHPDWFADRPWLFLDGPIGPDEERELGVLYRGFEQLVVRPPFERPAFDSP